MKARNGLRVLMMPDYRAGNPYQRLLASALEPLGVTVSFPKGYRRGLPIWRAALQERAQVLHLHWLSPYLKGRNFLSHILYAGKLCFDLCLVRMIGVRIIWTIHNRVSHEAQFPLIEQFVQNLVSRIAGRVIVHSDSAMRDMLHAHMPLDRARVCVIPHGHYAGAYSARVPTLEARRAMGWEADKMVFLFFGMVRPYKNVERLVEAWRSSPELAERATLVIAGEAVDPVYHHQIAGLARGVCGLKLQLARIPDQQVHLYFSAADVVVLPFTRILTSGSLLLSMTFAKPLIAPDLDMISETLHGADDLLYDSQDNDGIRKALHFAASPEADLAGLRARMEGLCADLSWDRIARLTNSAYGD
ncbi:MAG: glycosyl transferase group 1 [Bryobacterales bacterium]|nr:glycosyl transferase group 1 [Bryobacterales bacterium]